MSSNTHGLIATGALLLATPFAGLGAILAVASTAGVAAGLLTLGEGMGALAATLVLFGPAIAYVAWYLRSRGDGGE